MNKIETIREELRNKSPDLTSAIFDHLAEILVGSSAEPRSTSKDINDPIWKLFTLTHSQASIIDLPLMQRLRRVRQLGLAHLVYPGAQHSRLEHSIGTMRAATIMFTKLSRNTNLHHRDHIEQLISLAALLHDCGHTAFSHLGERVIGSIFETEFREARKVLQENLLDPISFNDQASPHRSSPSSKHVPAAEILSTLFVISPCMSSFIGRLGLPYTQEQACLFICGIIMGRPSSILRSGDEYHHYIKTIVSGDIDCDKIDYVARDAYYAGLPISADVDRLLSQLATAKLDQHTNAPGISVSFGDPHPTIYYLLAIRPAGASALEMFVMTRSYLFERIYTHHKVRAAERSLERLLREFLQYQKTFRGKNISWCLEFLMGRGGDDAVLDRLASWEDANLSAQNNFRNKAKRILDRQLPQRAFALSLRTLEDYRPQYGRLPSATFIPWSLAYEEIAQRTLDIEDEIFAHLDSGAGQIYLDWVGSNPVKENPDIWVHDPSDTNTLLRVNRYFDVEQLSNAYRDVKLTGWMFCDYNSRAEVAAATAYTLHEKYDLLPGREALRRAKISENSYQDALKKLEVKKGSASNGLINNLLNASSNRTLRPPPGAFLSALSALDDNERLPAAERLSAKFAAAAIPRHFYDDLQFALVAMEFLVRHQFVYNRSNVFKSSIANQNERRFQHHLVNYLKNDKQLSALCNIKEHTSASGGFTDVVISSKFNNRRPLIVELKSEQSGFQSQYSAHAGQPLQYAEDQYARVAFLYCQYASASSVRPSDTIDARSNANAESPQITICLAQRAFADVPSDGGATTTIIDATSATKTGHT